MEVKFYHVKEIWSDAGQCTFNGSISPPYHVLLELEVQNSSCRSSFHIPFPAEGRKKGQKEPATCLSQKYLGCCLMTLLLTSYSYIPSLVTRKAGKCILYPT